MRVPGLHEPLHMVESSKAAVLYRRGREEVNSVAAERSKAKTVEPYLTAYGTFGPILGAANDAIASSNPVGSAGSGTRIGFEPYSAT